MDLINRAYIEVMTAGDAKGRVFTFPIPTYNITPDFPWESENATLLFEMTAKYGLPYFQNFLNSELKPNMVRSMCCRLQLDLTELLKRGNGLFGSAEQTGSLGVVTINCARLGHLYAGDETALYAALDTLLELVAHEPRAQAQGHPAPHRRRAVPVHEALPRHAAEPLLDGRRQRHQRDDPQLHRRRARHHHAGGPRDGDPLPRPRARADHALPGGDRPPLQPRGHARRGHDVPLRPRGQQALPRRSCRPAPRTTRTTRTPRSCPPASPTTPSRRSPARRSCSASTPAAPCCTSTWASGSPRPRRARSS